MRRALLLLIVLAAAAAGAQPLVCPPEVTPSGKPCDGFHFHVQAWDPITRTFATLTGVNRFASQTACDRARDAAAKGNAAIVDYVKRVKQEQYEADRIGPCHCDRTFESGNTASLNDAQRRAQKRMAEEVRRHVRARLIDLDLAADSDLISSLWLLPAANSMLGGPRLTQLPAPGAVSVTNSPEDLRLPRNAQGSVPTATTFDLPLADPGGAPAAVATSTAPAATPPAAAPAGTAPPNATPQPVTAEIPKEPKLPIQETTVAVDTPPAPPASAEIPVARATEESSQLSAEDAADIFIRHETQRIQNVVNAVSDASDEMGEKVLEACTARIQALSNLRSLILGSGADSRIAKESRGSGADAERLALVTKLFGPDVAAHWMPKVTTDVLVPPSPQVDTNPEKVLRDSSGQSTDAQKRRALYVLLTRAPITEEQQLWLIPMVERFLQ